MIEQKLAVVELGTKKVFETLFLLLLLVSCGFINSEDKKLDLLRVAFPNFGKISDYDTTNVTRAYQYTVLENLFSTLVTVDYDGKIKGVLCESFGWKDDNTIYFKIKSKLITSHGQPITTKDFMLSIKRNLLLKSTHGELGHFLKNKSFKLNNIDDPHGMRAPNWRPCS